MENFILQVKDECINTVYTEGSVYSGTTGCGACSAILYSSAAVCVTRHDSRAVGRMVSCTECEIEGILLGMDSVLEYVNLNQQSTAHTRTAVYLFCDSVSAIEAIYKLSSLSSMHLHQVHQQTECTVSAAGCFRPQNLSSSYSCSLWITR